MLLEKDNHYRRDQFTYTADRTKLGIAKGTHPVILSIVFMDGKFEEVKLPSSLPSKISRERWQLMKEIVEEIEKIEEDFKIEELTIDGVDLEERESLHKERKIINVLKKKG